MLTASLDLAGLSAMAGRVQAGLDAGCTRIVAAAVREGAAEAVRVHQYRDRTGNLTKSIHGEMTFATKGSAEGEIVADAKYASFVENGTRPHDIRPRNAKALRWVDAGGVHFARVVHHPGTKPYPFMGPAYLKAEAVLETEAGVVMSEIAQREGT